MEKKQEKDIILYYAHSKKRLSEYERRLSAINKRYYVHKAIFLLIVYIMISFVANVFILPFLEGIEFSPPIGFLVYSVFIITNIVTLIIGIYKFAVTEDDFFFEKLSEYYESRFHKLKILKRIHNKIRIYEKRMERLSIKQCNIEKYNESLRNHYLNGTINDLDPDIVNRILGFDNSNQSKNNNKKRIVNEIESEKEIFIDNI